MNGGRIFENMKNKQIRSHHVFLLICGFFLFVCIQQASSSENTSVYVGSFYSENKPLHSCAVFIDGADILERSCSDFSLLVSDNEVSGGPSGRRYMVALPLHNTKLRNTSKTTDAIKVIFLTKNNSEEIVFLPVQNFDKANVHELDSFNESIFKEQQKIYESEGSVVLNDIERMEIELAEKKQLMSATPEGREYARLKNRKKSLELQKAELEEVTGAAESRLSSFMKDFSKTSNHREVKSDLSTRIRKLVEMNVQR